MSIGDRQITEGDNGTQNLTFTVRLDRASTAVVSVKANTHDGTAFAGQDFTAVLDQFIIFQPGETSKTVVVPILGDLRDEPTELFTVALSEEIGATLSAAGRVATGTILDNDVRTISVDGRYDRRREHAGTQELTFNVILSTGGDAAGQR